MKDLRRTGKSTSSHADSLFRQADKEWDRKRLRSAFRLFLSAARAGDAGAQANVGYFYDVGIGRKPNRRLALYWYGKAFRQGYSAGATNTGTIYRDQGQIRKALTWFRRAVRLGDADANLEIAKLYLREKKGVRKAIPYLNRTMRAASGTEVTEDARREARRLLKQLGRG